VPIAAGIHYRVSHGGGSKSDPPPLAFIHGAGGSSLHWPPQLRHLPGCEVYTLDLPGHGDSPGSSAETIAEKAEAVLAWKATLELEACVFAGHSMGGAIAQTLALDQPEAVAGLVLVGTGGRLRVHPDILAMTTTDEGFAQTLETILAWSYSPSADKRLVELAGKRMLQVPAQVVHADYLACDRFDVLPQLGQIHCPTLVICGNQDQLTPPKYSQYLVDQIPEATLVIIEGAGHMVMLEQPEAVSEEISQFMSQYLASSKRPGFE
jgi:pimeloyl-ACP methyl ester carboxylesterase